MPSAFVVHFYIAMKFYLLVLLSFAGCASSKQSETKFNPPGTVRVNDTLFVDQTEVSNLYWREYLLSFETRKDFPGLYNALPDTLVWTDTTDLSTKIVDSAISSLIGYTLNPLSEYYFRHPGFNMHPLVGITHEQAVDFCIWRTHAANANIYWRENKINPKYDSVYNIPIKFYYRLPTKEEWEMIAAGNMNVEQYPYGYKDVYTIKWKHRNDNFNCNYYSPEYENWRKKASFYTSPVKSFFPNSLGCFNMIGNVAEMVLEKGIAKGGSWTHPLDSCKIKIDQLYSKPEKWLGFRCVAVLVK